VALTVALAAGGLLGGCTASADPVQLPDDLVDGAVSVAQNTSGSYAFGPTWCDTILARWWVGAERQAASRPEVISSLFRFEDHGSVGATILDLSYDGTSAQDILDEVGDRAETCLTSDALDRGYAFEPLSGLPDGAVGWSSATTAGMRGEYVLLPLDASRVLAVGAETTSDDAPIDLDDLIAAALQGAEQFPAAD
jgi:hypothetical protein